MPEPLREINLWDITVDTLLGWVNLPNIVNQEALKHALDGARELRGTTPPPSMITATREREIIMLWQSDLQDMRVKFTARGKGTIGYTHHTPDE